MRFVAVVVLILLVAGSCQYYRWTECRQVGHGVLWCLAVVGGK